jgi:hypothetical protein
MNCAAREHNSPHAPPGWRSTVEAEGTVDRWYLRIKLYVQATWQVVCDIPHKLLPFAETTVHPHCCVSITPVGPGE